MRSVADFLAANRCAGRYLICTALSESNASVIGMVTAMEIFSRTGVSMGYWGAFTGIIFFIFTLFGLITYRFRETRCLTFHQFFELRYSKGLRVFASFLNIFSGLINFGLIPAVGARFFVYLAGLPDHIPLGPVSVPTFVALMFVFMALSMYMTLSGGQISVMVTDCVEGLISSIFYLIVALYIVFTISPLQMKQVMVSGSPGNSYVNPFDIGGRTDFNGWYILLGFVFSLCIFRGSAWTQGFNAAAKSAHESRMAAILSSWRGFGAAVMGSLVAIGAFTLLHHPDFATQQAQVQESLSHIANPQLRTQMTMPMALNILLPPGVKGAFLAICFFGLLASQGLQLHNYGSTLLQDVIMPRRKKPFTPKGHLLALRCTVAGIGVFVCLFSWLYKPVDYLTMMVALIGAIYLGGIGAVVWGGLYWKKGTTSGAWASMITGTSLAISFNIIQQFWTSLQPLLAMLTGDTRLGHFIAAHSERCPINGIQFAAGTAVTAFIVYVIVSFLTCKEDFDMNRMLHRGIHAITNDSDEPTAEAKARRKAWWEKFIGIDNHFTRGDRVLSIATSIWSFSWQIVAISILVWTITMGRLSDDWWFGYMMIASIKIPLVLAVVTTIWFTIGTVRDIRDLFKTLATARRDASDDGTIHKEAVHPDHPPSSVPVSPAAEVAKAE